jgi:hypothetical protein
MARMPNAVASCLAVALLAATPAHARVKTIQITRNEPVFDGVSFGRAGPYQKIAGTVQGEVDPADPLNALIVNIDKAPRNAAGLVEYDVDFYILKPADLRRGNRRIFYDVNNRGNKTVLGAFNDATTNPNDPTAAADAGNGFLMKHGYTIVWSGWQGDVAPGGDRITSRFPVATNGKELIVGMNRDEFIFDSPATSFTVALSYPAATLDPSQVQFTVRELERDPRVPMPADSWIFVDANTIQFNRPPGYDDGAIYEFIYPATNPIVMGLGFAAVRDFVSFLRHRAADDLGNPNPLAGPGHGDEDREDGSPTVISRAYTFGSSQSGRFLRDYLWQGFNEDENGRIVFDAMIPHIAGSRKTFTNFQFSQPGWWSKQHENHLQPGDQFPFTYATITDPVSGQTDGILARCEATHHGEDDGGHGHHGRGSTCPKILQIDGSTEFWQARASLVVTNGAGEEVALPSNVRAYLITGTNHGGGTAAPFYAFCGNTPSPVLLNPPQRALLVDLDEWVTRGVAPPASRYPNLRQGTLARTLPPSELGFPDIPGVTYSGLFNYLFVTDYSVQPPTTGAEYLVLEPKVDEDGNDIAGIRQPIVSVPVATYTGWNLRRPGDASPDLCTGAGSMFPFPATQADRMASGDPRLSVEERYPTHEDYVTAVRRAAGALVRERLLLAEDARAMVAEAEASNVGQ